MINLIFRVILLSVFPENASNMLFISNFPVIIRVMHDIIDIAISIPRVNLQVNN